MDLNHLYSQHQIALMRACAATSVAVRTGYLASASRIAGSIRRFQSSKGASAASSWQEHRLPGNGGCRTAGLAPSA